MVREHPERGIFVQDCASIPVTSYKEISSAIDTANENRTIGATNMNATSSRAHTVTTIMFKQTKFVDGQQTAATLSNINLIDLAGSERSGTTGATGDRLTEGANINKSLLILGKVIKALANKSKKGGAKDVVPYRESKLTLILKPNLGGNAKTAMIAAISPASINYEESVSTLKYAW